MTVTKTVLGVALAGVMAAISVGDASASVARKQARYGHHYGVGGGYGGGYYHHRRYGGYPVGAAVAGTALGVIGLAAGAAAANRGYDAYDPYGYGYGYGAPAYAAPSYGYGYQPDDSLF